MCSCANVVPFLFVEEGSLIRRFECPFCGFKHTFSPTGKNTFKKRVIGFTCPKCGKKATQDDIKKKVKGKGPKPKDQRRKRIKKEVIPDIPKFQPPKTDIEPIEWKTRTPFHTNPWERRYPNSRIRNRDNYLGKRIEKPLQPIDRSLEEVLVGSLKIKTSAPIPYRKFRNEKKLENRNGQMVDMEKFERHEKKFALLIVRLDRVEEKMEKNVKELDLRLTELDSKLQVFSTLTAHMEKIIQSVRR